MTTSSTIFALSTGQGLSAVAVVRLSGPAVRDVLLALTRRALPPERRFAVRQLHDPQSNEVLDVAGVLWMPGPASFTGEDCGELHLHGSRAVVSAVLRCLTGINGLQMAEPGEFSRRALVNGRMDLVAVEGLADLMAARTDVQRRNALVHTMGRAGEVFEAWRQQLVGILGLVEAAVDFSDQEGVAEMAVSRVDVDIDRLVATLEEELRGYGYAELMREGVTVVLAGMPNTGKSSLLNALARREAALVSPMAGTTRDVIDVALDLDGVPVVVSDMAGIRENVADEVEAAGVARAKQKIAAADVVVWVCSADVAGSEVVDPGIEADLVVIGKCDLAPSLPIQWRNDSSQRRIIHVSAVTGDGIGELVAALTGMAGERLGHREAPLIATVRQREAVTGALEALKQARETTGRALEIKAEHLRNAANWIGRLTGRIDVEEWLGSIFSRFCIGK